jgi:general nucleoside transport system permease protein
MKQNNGKKAIKEFFNIFLMQCFLIILGLLISSIVIFLSGKDVIAAYKALYEGAFVGRTNIELTILNAIPLIFTGLSIAVCFRAGLFNIGAEGQVLLGGIAATWIGYSVKLGPTLTPILALLASILAGVVWALPSAIWRAKKGVSEVITTLMFSYIALHFMSYARKHLLFDPTSTTMSSVTVNEDAKLILLDKVFPFLNIGTTRIHLGIIIAIITAIIIWLFLYKSVWGFELRAVGENSSAASANGISVPGNLIMAMCIGGAIAGLGGGVQLLGLYHRISTDSFIGLGFSGFFIALLAKNQPFGVIPAAIFFGAIRAGALNMQFAANVPINLTELLQGVLILIIAIPYLSELVFRKKVPQQGETHD